MIGNEVELDFIEKGVDSDKLTRVTGTILSLIEEGQDKRTYIAYVIKNDAIYIAISADSKSFFTESTEQLQQYQFRSIYKLDKESR